MKKKNPMYCFQISSNVTALAYALFSSAYFTCENVASLLMLMLVLIAQVGTRLKDGHTDAILVSSVGIFDTVIVLA